MIHTEGLELEKILEPISEETESYYLEKNEVMQWMGLNSVNLEDKHFMFILSNTAPFQDEGLKWVKAKFKYKEWFDEEKITDLYEKQLEIFEKTMNVASYAEAAEIGYFGEFKGVSKSPVEDIVRTIRNVAFENRGFSVTKSGKLECNANVFAKFILRKMRLIYHKGSFYTYYSGKWVVVEDAFIKKIVKKIMNEGQKDSWRSNIEKEILASLEREVIHIKEFNIDTNMLNLKNGMLNIENFELVPHHEKWFSSNRIDLNFNKSARCPKFLKFLYDIMENDEERVNILQELMGYFLTTDTRLQIGIFFYGMGGNGKGTLTEIIVAMLGEANVSSTPLSKMSGKFGINAMVGKLLNVSSENEFGSKGINTQVLKAITGEDLVEVEKKYKDAYSTKLKCKLLAHLNTLPNTDDLSEGFLRRLCIIPFNKRYSRDADVEGANPVNLKLKQELLVELEGILNFALDGLQRLVKNDYKLTESIACKRIIESYKEEQNPLVEFFRECIRITSGKKVLRPDIRKAFEKWAVSKDLQTSRFTPQVFWREMKILFSYKGINVEEDTKKHGGEYYLKNVELVDGKIVEFNLKAQLPMFMKDDIQKM